MEMVDFEGCCIVHRLLLMNAIVKHIITRVIFFTVAETLNSDKSDSNQCYSESESATNSPLFPFNSCFNIVQNMNVLQFNHKTYQ